MCNIKKLPLDFDFLDFFTFFFKLSPFLFLLETLFLLLFLNSLVLLILSLKSSKTIPLLLEVGLFLLSNF